MVMLLLVRSQFMRRSRYRQDADAALIEVIVEPDSRVGMLFIHIVPEDITVANGESWRRTSL